MPLFSCFAWLSSILKAAAPRRRFTILPVNAEPRSGLFLVYVPLQREPVHQLRLRWESFSSADAADHRAGSWTYRCTCNALGNPCEHGEALLDQLDQHLAVCEQALNLCQPLAPSAGAEPDLSQPPKWLDLPPEPGALLWSRSNRRDSRCEDLNH